MNVEIMRPSGRKHNEKRAVSAEIQISKYAEGSCLIKFGDTHVLCTASVEERVPPFLRGQGLGWVTAEYGMLPRSTHTRTDREAARGKQSGRTLEIQRLIGRSLRAVTDTKATTYCNITVNNKGTSESHLGPKLGNARESLSTLQTLVS